MSGKLPKGWIEAEIADLMDQLQYGYTESADSEAKGPRFLRITDIQNGTIDWSRVPGVEISEDDFNKYKLEEGDIVFARSGSIEKAARVVKPPPAIFASYLIRGRPTRGALAPWIQAFVSSNEYLRQAKAASAGIGRANINASKIGKLKIKVPPLGEQARIIEQLDALLPRLQAAIESLEQAQAKLNAYRASVLKAAVEGRLVPTEAELARGEQRDYEPADVLLKRMLAERRQRWEEAELAKMKAAGKAPKDNKWKAKYQEPAAPDTKALPQLPEGWCWGNVEQVLENHDYRRIPIKSADRMLRQGSFLYYGASGPIDTIDDFLFDGSFLLIGEDGANLLARSKPIAFQAHGRFWVNNHAHIVKTYLGLPLSFIEAVFNSIDLAPYVTGTAQPKLPQAAMNKIPIPIPPAAEQERIVEAVARLTSDGDAVFATVEANLRRITRIRQSILKWAFEGKLVDQDPNDEPAEKLVERLRAERVRKAPEKKTARRRKTKAAK